MDLLLPETRLQIPSVPLGQFGGHCAIPIFIQLHDYRIWSVLVERGYRTFVIDHLMMCLVEEWRLFDQQIIDRAIKQWRSRLRLYVRDQGGHFQQRFSAS